MEYILIQAACLISPQGIGQSIKKCAYINCHDYVLKDCVLITKKINNITRIHLFGSENLTTARWCEAG